MDTIEQPVCKANALRKKSGLWLSFSGYPCHTLILTSYKDNSLTCTKRNQSINKKRRLTEVAEVVLDITTTMLNACCLKKGPVAYVINHADPDSRLTHEMS